jgi:actin-related protein
MFNARSPPLPWEVSREVLQGLKDFPRDLVKLIVNKTRDASVGQLVESCIDAVGDAALWDKIVCIGGSSCLTGFVERLEAELSHRRKRAVVIEAAEDRQHSVWKGGLNVDLDIMTAELYEELGPENIVARFCK